VTGTNIDIFIYHNFSDTRPRAQGNQAKAEENQAKARGNQAKAEETMPWPRETKPSHEVLGQGRGNQAKARGNQAKARGNQAKVRVTKPLCEGRATIKGRDTRASNEGRSRQRGTRVGLGMLGGRPTSCMPWPMACQATGRGRTDPMVSPIYTL